MSKLKKTDRKWLILLIVGVLAFLAVISTALLAQVNARYPIAGGSENGTYNAFLTAASEAIDGIEIEPQLSQGSLDNLERLAAGDVGFAIAQNDIAYYTNSGEPGYTALSGFKSMFPLFPEYVQILVRAESNIAVLDDLRSFEGDTDRLTVGLGGQSSGSYRNALDILQAAGITPGEDFDVAYYGSGPGLDALRDGEIDVLFLTGRIRGSRHDDLNHVAIPEFIIDNLTRQFPYYTRTPAPAIIRHKLEADMLSVTAYLFVGDTMRNADVRRVTEGFVDAWPLLRRFKPDLLPLTEALVRSPIPYHPVVEDVLVERGLAQADFNYQALVILCLGVVVITLLALYRRSSYDRLGRADTLHRTWLQTTIDEIARFSPLILILTGFIFILSVFVLLIGIVEASYAIENNLENRFARVSFTQGLIWTFTFMVSGYPDAIFPASPSGKFFASLLALLGLALPLTVLYQLLNFVRNRASLRDRGEALFNHLNGHVLICGWNRKVPSLIYTLTGEEAPAKKHVVVVADPEEERPLAKWRFDRKLTHFCRGDAADYAVLRRAGAATAGHALILAREDSADAGKGGQEFESVLTAVALKKTNPAMFVGAEVADAANRKYLEAADTDLIVNSHTLGDRIFALASVTPYAVDFLLDCLTHDQFDEIYSISGTKILKFLKLPEEGTAIQTLCGAFLAHGFHVLGVIDTTQEPSHDAAAAHFGPDSPISPLMDREQLTRPVRADDQIIYFADRVYSRASDGRKRDIVEYGIRDETLIMDQSVACVLLVGPETRAKAILTEMRRSFPNLDGEIISPHGDGDGRLDKGLEDMLSRSRAPDSILFLNDEGRSGNLTDEEAYLADAKTIMRAKLVDKILATASRRPQVLAELNLIENRQLLIDAGVDTVVPTTLIAERLLAKSVYSKGHVSRILLAMLNMGDGIGLRTLKVNETSPYLGQTYCNLLAQPYTNARLLAWLPKNEREALKNKEGDFGTHFIMAPTKEHAAKTVQLGDELILLVSS